MFCDSCFFNIWSRVFTVQDIIYWRHRSSDEVNSWYHVWITFHVDFQALHKRTCNPSHHCSMLKRKILNLNMRILHYSFANHWNNGFSWISSQKQHKIRTKMYIQSEFVWKLEKKMCSILKSILFIIVAIKFEESDSNFDSNFAMAQQRQNFFGFFFEFFFFSQKCLQQRAIEIDLTLCVLWILWIENNMN